MIVGKSNQNDFVIQIDASNFAEFEISEFEISRFDCTLFWRRNVLALFLKTICAAHVFTTRSDCDKSIIFGSLYM